MCRHLNLDRGGTEHLIDVVGFDTTEDEEFP
jgi:hypothetical protein